MLHELPTVTQLLKGLQQIPYLSSKNLYRVAEYFLELDGKKVEQLCSLLLQAKNNIVKCSHCYVWHEKDKNCFFCASSKRDQSTVCVVERWQDLLAIEQTKGYAGVYHVLGGVIYPLNGVGPDDLSIDALVTRVGIQPIQEIILALSQTPEGEATGAYIARKLKNSSVRITCLARGLPVGSSLETVDRVTIFKALSERRPFG